MNRRHALAPALVAAFAAPFVVDCTILNGYSASVDAGIDSALDVAPAPDAAEAGVDADTCAHALPPAPPDPGGADPSSVAFVSTGRRVSFGVASDGGITDTYGYDLDRTCTCPAADTCARPTRACDLPGGVDDATRDLVALADVSGIHVSDDANDDIARGTNAILVWVDSYNGQADDAQVNVALLYSPGLYDVLPDGGMGAVRAPTFTGADAWTVTPAEAATNAGKTAPLQTMPGYVKDRTLVVHGALSFAISQEFTVTLPDGFLVAHVADAPGGGFVLDSGTLAGRWPIDKAIHAIGGKEWPKNSGHRLCDPSNALLMAAIQNRFCSARDVTVDPANDGKGLACDAMSMALHFDGAPASLGALRDSPAVVYCAGANLTCP